MNSFSQGFLLILATGFFWCAVGIFYSKAAEAKDSFFSFMLISFLCTFTFVLATAFPSPAPLKQTIAVCGIMAGAGISGILGFFALRNAMLCGHHGIAWCTAQAAMVCPFAAGSLIFHDRTAFSQYAGMGLLGTSLILLAAAKQTGKRTVENDKKRFCFRSISAFLLIGMQQTLSMLPLRFPWIGEDALTWRVPATVFCGILWVVPVLKTGEFHLKKSWKNALGYGFSAACGQLCVYQAIDRMHSAGSIGAVYPPACGICIAFFFLYCRLFRKEKSGFYGIAGVTVLILGILLFAVPKIR